MIINSKSSMNRIHNINHLFSRCFEKSDTFLSARKSSDVDPEVSQIIRKEIPSEIEKLINNKDFIVTGSVGKGLVAKTPWVAILDKSITSSTLKGVYIVFLFSSDYKHVYITLNQGTTVPGKFGHRLTMKAILSNTEQIRERLDYHNVDEYVNDNADIKDQKYKAGAVFCSTWDIDDAERGRELLDWYLTTYSDYKMLISDSSHNVKEVHASAVDKKQFSIRTIMERIQETGLKYDDVLVKRFAFSLMSKRFLILSGLAGSGKTQLAIAFASALADDIDRQVCVVSVGADWTNRDPLLGFPDALRTGKYVMPASGALKLIIEASRIENSNKPFFLVLDEMNMSYVERYFADFLSAMESGKSIMLWNESLCINGTKEIDGVPQCIDLPPNLFIIGTINVDETTYMFSPKVLDRANVIEFAISEKDMGRFLDDVCVIKREIVNGRAADMATSFVEIANNNDLGKDENVSLILRGFFKELKKVNAEFGYRSARDIFRFLRIVGAYDDSTTKMSGDEIMDAAIVQKLLPKLHGSRKKLVRVLSTLWDMCDTGIGIELADEVPVRTRYPLTADKLLRMYRGAIDNGFTSFAEA